jgi:hypothetical protein
VNGSGYRAEEITAILARCLSKFRNEVNRRLGMKKGNIKIAIEEAMRMWINQEIRKP